VSEGLFPLSQGKRAAPLGANQAKEFCGNLPISVASRDYLLPLEEQEEDQSSFAKVGQGSSKRVVGLLKTEGLRKVGWVDFGLAAVGIL
jgi:hypothetical protein